MASASDMMTGTDKPERVVVGVDGSAASRKAMAWAAKYGAATGATVRAVLAWHYPSQVGPAPVGVAPASVTAGVEQAQREELDEAVAAAVGNPPAIEVERTLAYGHPSAVLIEQSKDADLLVIGSRGRGGFSGLLLGSVGHHCVTHATCPVTVVRLTH